MRFLGLMAAQGLCLGLAACSNSGDTTPRVLRLTQFKQAGQERVLLNEALVFHFAKRLDPGTVSRSSVRIRDAQGHPAVGRLEVAGQQLRFLPQFPLAADLSDAGLRPATRYRVELLGFPLLAGLRGRSSEPLERGWSAEFTSADPLALGTPLFEDSSFDRGEFLELGADAIAPEQPIVLRCAEALDPRSLRAEDFELRSFSAQQPGGAPALLLQKLRARLIENQATAARIELVPVDEHGALQAFLPGEYHLWIDPKTCALRDLGGHPVLPAWQGMTARIEVREQPFSLPRGRFFESFTSPDLRSPAAVEGFDGTAWWSDNGRVSVRFPRAAGSGRDGEQQLAGNEQRSRIEATRLSLPAGSSAHLDCARACVLLAAQGRLEIAGTLSRELQTGGLEWSRPAAGEPAQAQGSSMRAPEGLGSMGSSFTQASPDGPLPHSLSSWLEQALANPQGWTVLVAGGDLVISGELFCDGPLLLVAGGRVRISGRVEASEVWRVGDGGGQGIRPDKGLAPLLLDPPLTNPLAVPLRFAVLSAPIRPAAGVARWSEGLWESGGNQGKVHLRWLGERDLHQGGSGPSVESVGPVDEPFLLEGCGALRLWIEVELWPQPGAAWQPAFLDWVELRWEEGVKRR